MGIAIAIVVVIALAVVALLVTARSRATTGRVSRETRKRDEAAGGSRRAEAVAPATRRPSPSRVRRRSCPCRRSPPGDRVGRVARSRSRAAERPPRSYEPVDLDELGVTRRQFFNRSILAGSGLGLGAFGVAALAFLWPGASSGFGGKIVVGSEADAKTAFDNKMPFYNATAKTYIVAYPKADLPARPRRWRPTRRRSSRAWRPGTSRSTRSACTSAAACRGARARSGSSARATARSTTGSARRSGWPGAAWPRPLRARGLGRQHRRRHREPRARAADRHQHHQPEPGRAALCLTRPARPSRALEPAPHELPHRPDPHQRGRSSSGSSVSSRYRVAPAASTTRSARPRTSRRSSTTTCSRARTSSGCSAWH